MAALLILILAFLFMKLNWKCSTPQDSVMVADKDSSDYVRDTTYIKETGLTLPPNIYVNDLSFDGDSYSFEVTVKNAPLVKFYYAVLNPYDNIKVVAKNNDGKFRGVPYSSADGGSYDIALLDASNDSLIYRVEKTGFIKQKAVTKQMPIDRLQSLINSRDISLMGVGENDYLSPDYELKFSGLPSDAVNVPTTLGEVFDKLENEIWSSVKVTSLNYDDMNRISVIHLSIKE
jgi:hypothetical protein